MYIALSNQSTKELLNESKRLIIEMLMQQEKIDELMRRVKETDEKIRIQQKNN
jgi:hypothetical protein